MSENREGQGCSWHGRIFKNGKWGNFSKLLPWQKRSTFTEAPCDKCAREREFVELARG